MSNLPCLSVFPSVSGAVGPFAFLVSFLYSSAVSFFFSDHACAQVFGTSFAQIFCHCFGPVVPLPFSADGFAVSFCGSLFSPPLSFLSTSAMIARCLVRCAVDMLIHPCVSEWPILRGQTKSRFGLEPHPSHTCRVCINSSCSAFFQVLQANRPNSSMNSISRVCRSLSCAFPSGGNTKSMSKIVAKSSSRRVVIQITFDVMSVRKPLLSTSALNRRGVTIIFNHNYNRIIFLNETVNLISHECHSHFHLTLATGIPLRKAMVMAGENVANDVDEEVYVYDGAEGREAQEASAGDRRAIADADQAGQLGISGETRTTRTLRTPEPPTNAARMAHNATHIPFRDWCPFCVQPCITFVEMCCGVVINFMCARTGGHEDLTKEALRHFAACGFFNPVIFQCDKEMSIIDVC